MALRSAETAPAAPAVTRLARPRQRQTNLAIAGLAVVVACALGAAMLARSSAHRVEVIVAAHDLGPGAPIQPSDLRVTRVSTDTSARFLATSAAGEVVGQVPRGFIPAGTPLNAGMVARTAQIPAGESVVGAVLNPGAMPTALQPGQRVDVLVVAKDSGGSALGTAASNGPVDAGTAVVFEVVPTSDTTTGAQWVSLEAPSRLGQIIAQAAQDGLLRLAEVPG